MIQNFSGNTSLQCDSLLFNVEYEIFDAVVSSVLALFGLVYAFFGYRCFQAVMFLTGLIFGATVVYLICHGQQFFDQEISFQMTIGISIGIGVVCGFIALIVRYVGIFLQGFTLGGLLALTVIMVVQIFYHIFSIWISIGVLFVSGCIFAVLTLAFQKSFLIISTSVFGSILIIACVDYFLEGLYFITYAWKSLTASNDKHLCWFAWLLIGAWLFLSVFGVLLQWKVTAKNYDHTDVVMRRRRRKSLRTHLVRERRSPRHSDTSLRRIPDVVEEPTQSSDADSSPVIDVDDVIIVDPPAFIEDSHVDLDGDEDGPPPSYYECVELGVGEPVSQDSHSIVQTTAEVYSRRSLYHEPPSEGIQSDLVRQMNSGFGYSVDSRRSTLSGRQSPVSARARSIRNSLNSRHRRSTGSSRTRDGKPKKGHASSQKHKSPSRARERNHSTTARSAEQTSRNDMQSLLADSSRARSSQGVMDAHVERLRAAESRRTTRQISGTSQ